MTGLSELAFMPCGKEIPGHGVCQRAMGHQGICKPSAMNPTYDVDKALISVTIPSQSVLTGGRTNYYLVRVEYPQREDQPAYTAECEDIGEALKLTPDEMNIFKEIWRSANARLGNGKPDHKALYGAEKIVHYAGRILRRLKRAVT